MIYYFLADYMKKDFVGFFIAIIFYGIGIIGNSIFPNIFQIWTAFRYIIFFLIGFKIRQNDNNLLRKIVVYFVILSEA